MSTRKIIENAYKAYGEGRTRDAFVDCAEHFKFHWVANPAQTRFSAAGISQDAMLAKLGEVTETFDYLAYELKTLLVDGDRAAAEVRISMRHKSTGRELDMTVADFWTVENGKITSLTEYFDTARVVAIEAGTAG